jgi:hypothetical protein
LVLLLPLVSLRISKTLWRLVEAAASSTCRGYSELLVFEAQASSFRCVLAFANFAVWRQGRDFAPKFRGKSGALKIRYFVSLVSF